MFPKNATIEEYAHFPNVQRLYTNGSFSYAESGGDFVNLEVGRYTSATASSCSGSGTRRNG